MDDGHESHLSLFIFHGLNPKDGYSYQESCQNYCTNNIIDFLSPSLPLSLLYF